MGMNSNKNIISKIRPGSIAKELGIGVGDIIISINKRPLLDIIDYMYHMADDYVEVEIESKDGDLFIYEIEKDPDEDLGIEFSNSLIDKAKSCSNKCMFCFIDQMPKGMRPTLYFKDDDSRLSFLQGNFITLTNMSDDEIQRIIDYRISSVNVSVHTTNPELRIKMLRNKNAGKLMDRLRAFDEAGLEINCQIVLVPEINDGDELDKTLRDLVKLDRSIKSVAIVPVGISKYREGLDELIPFDEKRANETIDQVHALQEEFLESRSTRFAFLSDEFYLLANRPVPQDQEYESYPQIENGVGMVRNFYEEVKSVLDSQEVDGRSGEATIVTGTLAYDFMVLIRDLVIEKFPNLDLKVQKIVNNFFGHTITVAGLVTGQDIIKQMKNYGTGHIMIVDDMLREQTDYLLDDVTLSDIESALNVDVSTAMVDGDDFINVIRGEVLL